MNLPKSNIEREIKLVEKLGDEIGYGNIMELASIIWSIKQEKTYGTSEGVFIPALRQDIHKKMLPKFLEEKDYIISIAKNIIIKTY